MKAKAKSTAVAAPKAPATPPPALSHDQVAACAREIWEKRGRPEGQDSDIWYEAERILREHSTTNSADEAVNGKEETLRSMSEPRPRNSRAL